MKEVLAKAESKMQKSVQALLNEYATIRAGRANPSVLDRVSVEYYGVPTPINQVAAVSVPDPRTLLITPWDKSVLRDIERAIMTSDIGINPQNDGTVIRLTFPPLNEERRKELGKTIYKYAEEAKVAIRSIRRDGIEKLKEMKKNAEITEDDLKIAEKKMQDLTDKYCKEIDAEAAVKEKEIMEL
ncbi:MAG: ribosome recycling factor [Ruminococcaceae bacterium]|nr:ribosome recycling factor [Oscillospiraceae bacterium]